MNYHWVNSVESYLDQYSNYYGRNVFTQALYNHEKQQKVTLWKDFLGKNYITNISLAKF